MNAQLTKLLAERKPTRRGIHSTANCYESADYYVRQVPELQACGFDWFKLLVSGDSGVNTVRKMYDAGYTGIFIIRPYDTSCPANVIDAKFVKWYTDAGAQLIESPFNEFYFDYENAWGRRLDVRTIEPVPVIVGPDGFLRHDLSKMVWPPKPAEATRMAAAMPPDWPKQVARGWAQFAKIVLEAGAIPTTPSIEGWQFDKIFIPLFQVLVDTYGDLLKESTVALHNRPLNHPITYMDDPGGWLAWRYVDTWLFARMGIHLPIGGTEAGPEPGWDQDNRFPKVTPEIHAQMWRSILSYDTPENYLFDCGWLWHGAGGFAAASWKENAQYGGDLPVVKMLKEWPQTPIIPPIVPPDPPKPPVTPIATELAAMAARLAEIALLVKE